MTMFRMEGFLLLTFGWMASSFIKHCVKGNHKHVQANTFLQTVGSGEELRFVPLTASAAETFRATSKALSRTRLYKLKQFKV